MNQVAFLDIILLIGSSSTGLITVAIARLMVIELFIARSFRPILCQTSIVVCVPDTLLTRNLCKT